MCGRCYSRNAALILLRLPHQWHVLSAPEEACEVQRDYWQSHAGRPYDPG
jgi:hypothetical protein